MYCARTFDRCCFELVLAMWSAGIFFFDEYDSEVINELVQSQQDAPIIREEMFMWRDEHWMNKCF